MPFGIDGVDGLLAGFEALLNEGQQYAIFVIVAVENAQI